MTKALGDGAVDVALTAPEGSIADAAAGGPLRVVAGLIDRPPLSMIALARHRTVDDLRGGLIGTSSMTEGTRTGLFGETTVRSKEKKPFILNDRWSHPVGR